MSFQYAPRDGDPRRIAAAPKRAVLHLMLGNHRVVVAHRMDARADLHNRRRLGRRQPAIVRTVFLQARGSAIVGCTR